jgi:hypothetical protein
MLEVSVEPSHLIAGQRAQLAIRFTNTGRRACSDIVFKLGLPPGILLLSGRNRAEASTVAAGRTYVHEVTVQPGRPGNYQVTSANFSYRDEFDRPVRVPDFRAPLIVEAAPVAPAAVGPTGRLTVECGGADMALREWGIMPILVRNTTGVPLSDVSVAVSGPFHPDGTRASIPALDNGAAYRVRLNLRPDEAGQVPVKVHTTYNYLDGRGSVLSREQKDSFHVLVAASKEPVPRPGPRPEPVTTILFLAATPRELERIHPERELRKIERELRIDWNREGFRLKSNEAVQLTDVSRALVENKPHVVHFSGHGDELGRIYLEDDEGHAKPTTTDGLAHMFGLYKSTIRCVVVNACHSLRLAETISRHIDYAVGMRDSIGDDAAILFSAGFYQALFGGEEIPRAFELACSLLQSDEGTAPQHLTPVLYSLGRVHPASGT